MENSFIYHISVVKRRERMVFKLAVNLKMITGAIEKVADIAMSSSGQKFICGTYSDGKPRSVVDAMRDE